MKKLFALSFLPASADAGLLILRVVFGGAMVALHGWPKLMDFGSKFHSFPDPLGITHEISYLLAVGGEVVAAALVVLGCYTRFAALSTAITMGVAFFIVHGGALSGQGSGEMAMLYGAVFLALVITGGGKYSVDAKIGNP